MKRTLWLLLFLVGCEGKREAPKPLAVALPNASPAVATPTPMLFADIYRRRLVPPGTETNVDRAETALTKAPKDPKALKAVGLAYYAAGGYEAAIRKLTGLTDPEAQLYLGLAHLGLGNYSEAESVLKNAPGPVAALELGNLYFRALQQDEKAETCFVAAQQGDTTGEALLALGLLKASQGKTAEAQKNLVKATAKLPVGKARAAAFAALGRLESDPVKARGWYDKTRQDDPENSWLKKLLK